MDYRPEIDGLRAVAVLAVVFFHFEIWPFTGGYAGVDVFFVISGYLITSIIQNDLRRGTFSLVAFYERRARRILPALLAVLMTTLLGCALLFLPEQYESVGQAAVATVFFVSNFFFWTETGYFAAAAELQPLLHTWSLAVEEQFYLAFPLLLMLMAPQRVRWTVVAISAGAVVSLAFSEWAVVNKPSVAFYFSPSRAWELAIGALLALATSRSFSRRTHEVVSAAGLSMIVLTFLIFDPQVGFPGFAALLPCLGAAAFIWATGGHPTVMGRMISTAPAVFIGKISYSLYLWHWPVAVFARHLEVSPHLSASTTLFALAISAALAVFSWAVIERPFRSKIWINQRQIFVASAATMAGVAALGGYVALHDGLPERLSEPVLRYAAGANDFSAEGRRCLAVSTTSAIEHCRFGAAGTPPEYLLWGDSHAAALLPALDRAADTQRASGVLLAFNACPPLLGLTYDRAARPDQIRCREANEKAIQALHQSTIQTVVLVANWPSYMHAGALIDNAARSSNASGSLEVGLRRTLEALQVAGKAAVIIYGLPQPGFDVPWTLAMSRHLGRQIPNVAKPPSSGDIAPLLQTIANQDVALIDLSEAMCERGCALASGLRPLFTDGNHISAYAAEEMIGPFLERELVSRAAH